MQLFLALAIAVGSWIHVPGDAWQPGSAELSDAKAKLKTYATAQAMAHRDKLAAWDAYTFQYQGRDQGGRKVIYINAFCSEPPDYAEQHMVEVFDGGACYFRAYYDVDTRSFAGISFNGLA